MRATGPFLTSTVSVSILLLPCLALKLQEIRPQSLHGVGSKWLTKRDNTVFGLRNSETFL